MKILNRGKDSKDTESFNKIKVNDEPSLKLKWTLCQVH